MRLRVLGIALLGLLARFPGPVGAAPEPDLAAARDALARHAKEPFEQRAREAALRDLGRVGGEEAAAIVASVLDDPFVHLRDHAVSAWIAMLRGPRADATEDWVRRTPLVDPAHPKVRRAAAVGAPTARAGAAVMRGAERTAVPYGERTAAALPSRARAPRRAGRGGSAA